MRQLFRRSAERGEGPAPEPPQRRRPPSQHQQELLTEAHTHWGRGLAIVVGIAGITIAFFVILTLVPKVGSGNPLDSLTNPSNNANSSAASASATVAGSSTTIAAVRNATVATAARPAGSPGPGGTPTPRFLAQSRGGSPNIRSAPSTENNRLGSLAPGRQVEVLGKSADGAWLQIVWDSGQKVWVAQDLMSFVNGDIGQLPVVR